MEKIDTAALAISAVGAVTWLTEKWLNFNAVDKFIPASFTKYVYGLVGIAGIYGLYLLATKK